MTSSCGAGATRSKVDDDDGQIGSRDAAQMFRMVRIAVLGEDLNYRSHFRLGRQAVHWALNVPVMIASIAA